MALSAQILEIPVLVDTAVDERNDVVDPALIEQRDCIAVLARVLVAQRNPLAP
jgi:hypothetical protein